jgi:chlorobactene glucosyltransferase
MPLLVLCIAWLALVAWLIAHAYGQRGVLRRVAVRAPEPQSALPAVALVVPARDEGANIERCIRSLLMQQYPALQIIAVDDASGDDTPQILARLAREDARLRVLSAPVLPAGWMGKVHACWIGANAVPPETPWLCFLDADMRAHPLAIASALAAATSAGIDLLTLAPRHELGSFAERLILPCGLYLLGFSQDLAKIQAPESGEVVATGQFMLVRRTAYDDAGGHAAVRAEICEDVELARALKRRGYRVLLEDGSEILTTRMYTGWRTLWPGIAKNLIDMLGGPVRTLSTVAIAVTLAWAAVVLPAAAALGCRAGDHAACLALVPAGLGSAAILGLHVAGAIHFGIPIWYGLLFPLGYSAGGVLALDSLRWRLARRVHWKGRVYQ